jgi:hypothetical protein
MAPLNRSCFDQVQPIDFEGDAGLARDLLGADDLWEEGPTPGARRRAHPAVERLRDARGAPP